MRLVCSLSAPANVLLAGEYAITVEGGRGIAAAVSPRARADLLVADDLEDTEIVSLLERDGGRAITISARMGGHAAPHARSTAALLEALSIELGLGGDGAEEGADRGTPTGEHATLRRERTPILIEIDTSSFFEPNDGGKRGLGSSAVATLLAVSSIVSLLGGDPVRDLERTIAAAIGAHRRLHGGRGSGYDVATSAFGGCVEFTGGAEPSVASSNLSTLLDDTGITLYSLSAGKPVDSAAAVRRFEQSVAAEARDRLVRESNEVVRSIKSSSGRQELFALIASAREISEEIGRAIGVDATLPYGTSYVADGWVAKASGAGNERAIVFTEPSPHRPLPGGAEALEIDRRGLAWEVRPPGQPRPLRRGSGRAVTETFDAEPHAWRASAPGKLLLFGEHAAVYGHPAVGVALDRTLTVEVTPDPEWRFCFGRSVPCEDFGGKYRSFFPHLERISSTADLAERCKRLRGRVVVDADVPIASGFGSSAALCAALAQLLLPSERSSDEEVWRIAHRLEAYFHGTASGIDTGLVVLGGVRAFRFTADRELPVAHPVRLPSTSIVYGSIPRTATTHDLVAGVRGALTREPEATHSVLARLGAIADTVAGGGVSTTAELGALASEAHGLLRRLGVSNDALNEIVEVGVRGGATGGKLSGAGGGGAFFLVCSDDGTAENVRDKITRLIGHKATAQPVILQMKASTEIDLA